MATWVMVSTGARQTPETVEGKRLFADLTRHEQLEVTRLYIASGTFYENIYEFLTQQHAEKGIAV